MENDEDDTRPPRGLGDRVTRVEERLRGVLRTEHAHDLMEYARKGDEETRKLVGERITDFRLEMRELFKHSEVQSKADLYRAIKESEDRIQASIVAAIAAAQAPPKSGWHPAVTYGGGGTAIASLLWLMLAAMGVHVPGLGG